MNMISLAVVFDQINAPLVASACHDFTQLVEQTIREASPTVFRDQNEVIIQAVDAVAA